MRFHFMLAGGILAAAFIAPAAPRAATITTDFSAWAAAAGDYSTTSNTGIAPYSIVTTVPLSDATTLTVAGASDTLYQAYTSWIGWSGGYTGDVIDTSTNSETITFSGLKALGMELSPNFPLFGPYAETFTVTLSDGTTAQVSGSYPVGTTQFVGFYGGGGEVTSMTISGSSPVDFAFGNIVDAPEPLSLSLLVVGLAGLGLARRYGLNR